MPVGLETFMTDLHVINRTTLCLKEKNMDRRKLIYALVIVSILGILIFFGIRTIRNINERAVFAEADVNCKGGSKWTVFVPGKATSHIDQDDKGNILKYSLDGPGGVAQVDCTANGGAGSCAAILGNSRCK